LDRSATIWKYSPPALVLLGFGFLLLIPTFWGGISNLLGRWGTQEEYSHGYLIPLVSAYLIWERRNLLKTLEFRPSWLPVGVVVLATAVAVIGEISALYILIHFALVLIILAMAWSILGWEAFRYVLIPLALLAFAIPLPYFLEATLTADLQLVSSQLGVALIRLFEIPVYAEGNVIDLGSYQLQVVEACSGLRYLYPLMGVGFIVVYLYQVAFWKRALIFFSTIPITILMNSIRIGIIGILVNYWGQGMAEGFLHFFEGWIIFIACLAILLGEMWLLNRLSSPPVTFRQVFGMPAGPDLDETRSEVRTRAVSGPFVACVALVLVSLAVIQAIDTRDEVIPEREKFVAFPLHFEGWRGSQENLEPIFYNKLGLTDYLLNTYARPAEPPVNFYVAYYESQRKGISPHSPRVCVPAGGWTITDLKRVEISLGNPAGTIRVNRAVIQKGMRKQLVYYWFKQRGRDIANEYFMKWYLLSDSLTRNRTDGSLVRLTTPILPGEKNADAERRLKDFLEAVNPMLDDYVPI